MDDHELLRRYVQDRSQDAFRQLVDRHLVMVYSAARRMVRDAHLAEEIAQGVFTTLAQKAGSLSPPQVVGGMALPHDPASGDESMGSGGADSHFWAVN